MTRQDWLAWFWVLDGLSPELCHALRHQSRESDVRDAELMRRCVDWRWIPSLNSIRPESFTEWSDWSEDNRGLPLQRIDCGGDLSADWYHCPT